MLPYAAAHDIGVLVYGPLAHGLLGGHLRAGATFPDGDWRAHSDVFTGESFARNLGAVAELEQPARDDQVLSRIDAIMADRRASGRTVAGKCLRSTREPARD